MQILHLNALLSILSWEVFASWAWNVYKAATVICRRYTWGLINVISLLKVNGWASGAIMFNLSWRTVHTAIIQGNNTTSCYVSQAPRPSTGPHKLRECLPLIIFLRNRLKYALTGDEVKKICMQRFIKIDGKVRTDITYPAGFMGEFTLKSYSQLISMGEFSEILQSFQSMFLQRNNDVAHAWQIHNYKANRQNTAQSQTCILINVSHLWLIDEFMIKGDPWGSFNKNSRQFRSTEM